MVVDQHLAPNCLLDVSTLVPKSP